MKETGFIFPNNKDKFRQKRYALQQTETNNSEQINESIY